MSDAADDGHRVLDAAAPGAAVPDAVTPDAAAGGALSDGVTTPSVDSLLAAAVRGGGEADSVGEARAVAAFRAARETGVRTARTRRRDDWRPNARRRVQLSIRTTLAALLAGLTLGGVAFAAVGSATHDAEGPGREHTGDGGQDRRPRTTDSVPARPGAPTVGRPHRDGQPIASRRPDKTDPHGNGGGKRDGNGNANANGDRQRQSSRPADPDPSRPGVSRAPNGRPAGADGRRPGDEGRNPPVAGPGPGGEARGPETK